MNFKIKDIFGLIILCIFLSIIFYISGITGALGFVLYLLIFLILSYSFHIFWKTIWKKQIQHFYDYARNYVFISAIILTIFTTVIGSFLYYYNEKSPGKMPLYTLSNGQKEVQFQTMIHIADKRFYEEVQENIKNYKQNGGVYFYEGVLPGTEENTKDFHTALGLKFEKDLYKNIGVLYGTVSQNSVNFLGLHNEKDFNVDVDIDTIMQEYNKLSNKPSITNNPVDANALSQELVQLLNPRELAVIQYINRAFLNLLNTSSNTQEALIDYQQNPALFRIILDYRNTIVANKIQNSEHKKIFVTYGALHFKGVLELLQQQDPNWSITNVEYLYPILSK